MQSILESPTLAQAAAQRFRMDRVVLNESAASILRELKLLDSLPTFDHQIEAFRVIDERNVPAEDELQEIERRLKTIDVRRRHAKDEAQRSRLLKSKTEKWEDANRQQALSKEHGQLVARRHQVRVSLKESDDVLGSLMEQIEGEGRLRYDH